MARRRSSLSPASRRSRGFVLLIVLWSLVLIGFIAAHLAASGRTEVRIAGNLAANAAAAAALEGAFDAAIFNLSDPDPQRRWPLDGAPHQLDIGATRVELALEDEATRINPSSASPALLEGLLRITGGSPEGAHRLALAIADWVGSAAVKRPPSELLAEYRAAGLDYGPPGSPLETLDELGRVLGMTPEVVAALRPHLTLYGPAQPQPAGGDPAVAAALAFAAESAPRAGPGAAFATAPANDIAIVRITASAHGPGGALVRRMAIVRVAAGTPHGYALLASEALPQ